MSQPTPSTSAPSTHPTEPISASTPGTDSEFAITAPALGHGGGMWRVARDSGALDLNTSYAYLLFARDFAATSRVAVQDGQVVGFVTGYLRPDAPDRLFVWQVAVDEAMRGHRVAARMLDALIADHPAVRWVETTITDDNTASRRLFTSFAERHGTQLTTESLFEEHHFPDGHEAEPLRLIGEIPPGRRATNGDPA